MCSIEDGTVATDEVLLHDAVSGFLVTMTNKIITVAISIASYGALCPLNL